MPGLDLLTEDEADTWGCVFLVDKGEDGGVERFEDLRGKGADVIEIDLERMLYVEAHGGDQLACEFGWEGHFLVDEGTGELSVSTDKSRKAS